MRYSILIIMSMLFTQYVQAQSEFDMQIDPKKLNKYLHKNKSAEQKITPLNVLQLPADTARYSHTIIQGDVYALPQDNMPCLRPDNNMYLYNQPNPLLYEKSILDKIINIPTIRSKPLVWEKKP